MKRQSTLYTAITFFSFILAVIGFTACNNVNNNHVEQQKGHLNVHLTDAPANYDAVWIDVQEVRVRFEGSTTDTTESSPEWITISDTPMRVNLLDLTNGVDTLLASADLETGNYSNLRLVLGDNNEVVIDGQSHNLKVPSGQQSGYKVKINTFIEAGMDYNLLVDFDASRSVHMAGNSGKYILKPVLKAVSVEKAGSISGVVQPSEANPQILAVMDGDTTATMADTSGGFMVRGLSAGIYDLSIKPTNDQYNDTTLTDKNVMQGEDTSVDTVEVSMN